MRMTRTEFKPQGHWRLNANGKTSLKDGSFDHRVVARPEGTDESPRGEEERVRL